MNVALLAWLLPCGTMEAQQPQQVSFCDLIRVDAVSKFGAVPEALTALERKRLCVCGPHLEQHIDERVGGIGAKLVRALEPAQSQASPSNGWPTVWSRQLKCS